jgi:hypothetical protein
MRINDKVIGCIRLLLGILMLTLLIRAISQNMGKHLPNFIQLVPLLVTSLLLLYSGVMIYWAYLNSRQKELDYKGIRIFIYVCNILLGMVALKLAFDNDPDQNLIKRVLQAIGGGICIFLVIYDSMKKKQISRPNTI